MVNDWPRDYVTRNQLNCQVAKMSSSIVARFTLVALAGSLMVGVRAQHAEAKRKTLLEQWFPKAAQRMQQRREYRDYILEEPVNRLPLSGSRSAIDQSDPEPIKKITGPSYYTYKTETLSTLSLAGLITGPSVTSSPLPDATADGEVANEPGDSMVLRKGDDPAYVIDPSKTGATAQAAGNAGENAARDLTNEALSGWSLKVETDIGKTIKDHYTKAPQYLWVEQSGSLNANGKAVLEVLQNAAEVGLSFEDYGVDVNALQTGETADAEQRAAKLEIAITAAALRYGADAKYGRINPNLISGYHDFPDYKRDYSAVMQVLESGEQAAFALSGLNPNNSRFAMLMAELAELKTASSENDLEPVAAGTFFRPGQENAELPRVIALVKRKASAELVLAHGATLDSYTGSTVFSDDLVALVKDFQKENGLGADGIVGKNTLAKLHIDTPKANIDKIELAMERLRWLPSSFGQRHVFINQPAYTASYMVDDKSQLSMRAIVGQPSNQTSFFYDTIELVEVNPYWNVPRSILVNEMLGKIRANPGYLTAANYEVVSYNGKPKDPYSVDWYSQKGTNGVFVRQKPGAKNALGELKILFPNKHAIYMHDTPSRQLFSRDSRALSHGCIRLQHPREMAAAVLESSVGQISSYVEAGKNQTIKVNNKLPVYVSYFTAWPGDDGKVGYYSDIYGRDAALQKAISATRKMRTATEFVSS